jgi:manganese-dependent ADP-ribose/CDP-alcohol diphosphatase
MSFFISLFFVTITLLSMTQKNNNGSSFCADQSQKPLFSFGLIADVQYCDCDPAGTRFYRSSPAKLREAINSFKEDSAAFIINVGDLIEKDIDSYQKVLNIIDSSGIKTWHCTGNHDFSVESRFKKQIPVLHPLKKGYYSFNYDQFRFIFLNGNEVSTYASNNKAIIKEAQRLIESLKSEGEINAIDWNGAIGKTQLGWLEKQLNESLSNNEKVFLICHFPVYPPDLYNLLNYKEVLSVLEKYNNIIAWLNGHNHSGNYGNYNMIHFVTFKGMVETESTNSYALIEVYGNKILIKGSGREKSQILEW